MYLDDDIDKNEYEKRKAEFQKQLEKNIEELNKIEKPKDLTQLESLINSDFATMYYSLNRRNRRRFWASFIDKIYIENAKVDHIIFL